MTDRTAAVPAPTAAPSEAGPAHPVSSFATWGLVAAWAVHDLEELATMPGWARRARPRLERAVPWLPGAVWDRLDTDRAHAAAAIGLTGAVMLAASADGARTGGRSAFYQAALTGFGLHTATHLASAAVLRGYTPGVVTAPLVAAPFTVLALRHLRRAGVPAAGPRISAAAFALFPVVLAGVHAGAAGVVSLHRARGKRGRRA